jgi:hypothetical protein
MEYGFSIYKIFSQTQMLLKTALSDLKRGTVITQSLISMWLLLERPLLLLVNLSFFPPKVPSGPVQRSSVKFHEGSIFPEGRPHPPILGHLPGPPEEVATRSVTCPLLTVHLWGPVLQEAFLGVELFQTC